MKGKEIADNNARLQKIADYEKAEALQKYEQKIKAVQEDKDKRNASARIIK